MSGILTILRLGAQGDGIAETRQGQVFVPFALPGETVNASLDGQKADLVSVIEPSPLRVEPPCRHFGDCGGCALQHLEEAAYRDWIVFFTEYPLAIINPNVRLRLNWE